MSIRVLQIHKRDSYEYKYIQDKYSVNPDTMLFALADGTTQSFLSELWATVLTNEFIKKPSFDPENLISRFKEIVPLYKNVKFNYSSNPAKASLEKTKQKYGGTAAFIGAQIKNNCEIDVISCGDSNLFLIREGNAIDCFPFADSNTLDANNSFINTEALLKDEVDKSFFKHTQLKCEEKNIVVLATDALSRLILKEPNVIQDLLKIHSFKELHDFCIKKWDDKVLEEDDISAIIIPIGETDSVKYIVPPDNFSFPKKEDSGFKRNQEQLPPSLLPQLISEVSDLRERFYVVVDDIFLLRSQINFQKTLLVAIICLLVLNIFLLFMTGVSSQIDRVMRNLINLVKR